MESTSAEIDTGEYDKNVQSTSGGRKSRKKERKPKKETRYFSSLNNPPIIKCPHTVSQKIGKKKCVGASLSIGDVEGKHLKYLLELNYMTWEQFMRRDIHQCTFL